MREGLHARVVIITGGGTDLGAATEKAPNHSPPRAPPFRG